MTPFATQEHELVEAQETSKSAKAAYEKFSSEAADHAKQIEGLERLKDEKLAGLSSFSRTCHRAFGLCRSTP